jgi:hypothetical protein
MNNPNPEVHSIPAVAPSPWWLRLILVVLGLAVWFWTQSLIGQRFPGRPSAMSCRF